MFFCQQALYASKIISYTQGFMLLRQAAKEFGWSLNYGAIALMWRGGCIIRRYLQVFHTTTLCNTMSTRVFHTDGENCGQAEEELLERAIKILVDMVYVYKFN